MLDLGQTHCVPLRNQPQRELNKIKDAESAHKEMSENSVQTEQCKGNVEKDGKISNCMQPGQMMEGNQERVNE